MLLTTAPLAGFMPQVSARVLALAADTQLQIGGATLVGKSATELQPDHVAGSPAAMRRRLVRVLLADLQQLPGQLKAGDLCAIVGDATTWCLSQRPTLHESAGLATLTLERA